MANRVCCSPGVTENQNFVSEIDQVRGDDELDFFFENQVQLLRLGDYIFDEVEVEQGFSPLELNFDVFIGCLEHPLQGLVSVLPGHIEGSDVRILPRDLAVLARVVAAEGDHKDMQPGEICDRFDPILNLDVKQTQTFLCLLCKV